MKTFLSFYGGIIAAAWCFWIWNDTGKRWIRTALLLAAGAGLGSYAYDVTTVCILPELANCSWPWK